MLREVADLEVVAALTASRIMTADLGHHGRLAGGPAVGMASVIDVGTVMLRRERPGVGVVRVLSPPRGRRVLPQVARGSRESSLPGADSSACRVVPFYSR